MRKLSFFKDKKGTAAVEAAMLFPIMITLILGMWDMGYGVLANQNTVTAAQVVGDLVTRERFMDQNKIDNYMEAGRLAYGNYATSSYGVDIVSVSYNDAGTPQIEWRETQNMTPDANALQKAQGLGSAGEGVVVVTVQYVYTPTFSEILTGPLTMKEQSVLRGRISPVVEWES